MTKKEKQALARKIIKITDEELDREHFIHRLLEESALYNIYEDDEPTAGQKAADAIAKFAGSWGFIACFAAFLAVWIVLNRYFLRNPFDPYPFILLNLILSCISALQAPLIMMSQNRQEEKDRLRSEGDYKINLKSEIIIEDIHYKLDNILLQQDKIMEHMEKNKNKR